MNPKQAFQARATLKSGIRKFFQDRDYLEVDAPILVPCPGTEVHLDYFESHWLDFQHKSHKLFLRSSPELHLKQAMSFGLDKVFQLAPCFRNGGEASQWHHPEFTMLEWYESNISYEAFMDSTVDLIRHCRSSLVAAGFDCPPLADHFEKISVADAFLKFTGIPLLDEDPDLAQKAIAMGNPSVRDDDDFETAFFKLMLDHVEPALKEKKAIILYDYPASQSALARVIDGKAKRFELYINGIELSNAFLELLDSKENEARIQQSQQRRKALGKQEIANDPHFIMALERGIPQSCGNAMGFDRLLALLLGLEGIQDIIPFHENQTFPL